jgi:hypothetical protein
MAMAEPKAAASVRTTRKPDVSRAGFPHAQLLKEARAAGLLDGEKSEHVSFRAPPSLIEAAKREAGVTSTTELGLLALALLAQPDPVVSAMRHSRGRLGPDHQLEY